MYFFGVLVEVLARLVLLDAPDAPAPIPAPPNVALLSDRSVTPFLSCWSEAYVETRCGLIRVSESSY